MANKVYDLWGQEVIKGTSGTALNGSGTTGLYAALIDTGTYTFSQTHQYYSNLSGIVGTPVEVGTKTYTNGVLDFADPTWSAVAGNTAEAIVLYVKAVPTLHIPDVDVVTDVGEDGRQAAFKVEVAVEEGPSHAASGSLDDGSVGLALSDPDGRIIDRQTKAFSCPGPAEPLTIPFVGQVDGSSLWDAEHPRLHTLTIELSAGGRKLETVVRRAGLREIEVAGTRLFVNGRPVKVRGINRHEVHPLRGRSLTPELWRKDAELFRAANINYIRTSHYPCCFHLSCLLPSLLSSTCHRFRRICGKSRCNCKRKHECNNNR